MRGLLRRNRAHRRLRVAAAAAIALAAVQAQPAAACTGESVPLDRITGSAEAIVVADVVGRGVPPATQPQGSYKLVVVEVLSGSAPATFEIPWGAAADTCDSFSASVGDRVIVALRASGFGQTVYAYWPVRQAEVRPGARTDRVLLDLSLGRNPAEAFSTSNLLVAALLLTLIVAVVVWRQRSQTAL